MGISKKREKGIFPGKNKGILEVSSAIRRYFGLECAYEPDPDVSGWLKKNAFRCVIVFLIDGMGSSILEAHREETPFIHKYRIMDTETVFPPTTTAATTALLTGKSPKETGWLGWNQQFSEKNDQIILFRNISQYGDGCYPGFALETLPVTVIFEELNNKGIKADSVWPFFGRTNACDSYQEMIETTASLAKDPEMRFLYVYWDAFDTFLHRNGPSSPMTGKILKEIDEELVKMTSELPDDAGMIILADHSQVDATHCHLDEDAELNACLLYPPSIEQRAAALFIRPEKKEIFPELFRRKLGDSFVLYSKEEVLNSDLFGEGEAHPRFADFIGDYLAVAITPLQLDYGFGTAVNGNHAGGMEEERIIPVILYPQ